MDSVGSDFVLSLERKNLPTPVSSLLPVNPAGTAQVSGPEKTGKPSDLSKTRKISGVRFESSAVRHNEADESFQLSDLCRPQ